MTLLDLFQSHIGAISEPRMAVVPAAQLVTEIILSTLLQYHPAILQESGEYALAANVPHVVLHDDFLSFAEPPYHEEGRTQLAPLPKGMRREITTGNPTYYEIKGDRAVIFPTPTATGTLLTEEYRRPGVLTSMADDIPFSGLFNIVYIDLVPRIMKDGALIAQDPSIKSMVREQVLTTVNRRHTRNTVMTSCETF